MFGLRIIKIRGHSMEPTLKAGSFALVKTTTKNVKVGDIIVCIDSNKNYLVKRLFKINDVEMELRGDNPADSYDSRNFGPIKKSQIIGKVIWH